MKSVTKIIVLLVLVLIVLIALITSASAQAEPKFTFPAAGSTVTGDINITRVEFDEAIDPALSGLELRNGEGHLLADGVGYGNCDVFSCHLYLGQLKPDSYTVTYDVITVSGKAQKGQFKFSIAGAN